MADRQWTADADGVPERPVSAAAARVRDAAFARLLAGQPTAVGDLAAAAGGTEAARAALDELAAVGVVQREGDEVVGVRGLAAHQTAHAVEIDGRVLHTWCAFDTVGIPAALGLDALARTRCPHCGAELALVVAAGAPPPGSPVVGFWPEQDCGRLVEDFCPSANLFCSTDHLQAWWQDAGRPPGRRRGLEELARAGRATWDVG